MTEYITKEQALKIIDNVEVDTSYWAITIDGYVTPKPDTFERLHTEINNLTPVDVAPVVHGEWLDLSEDGPEAVKGIYACSVCGNWHRPYKRFYRYCPYCGARMDGGDEK